MTQGIVFLLWRIRNDGLQHLGFGCIFKWALGWIDPRAITNSTKLTNKGLTVTLKPFESSGDALVVGLPNNNGWYGEEYIILEYYTPTGLNERDSQYAYGSYSPLSGSSYPKGFTQSGIIAYHVDSRYGIFTASSKGYSLSSYVLTENALMNPKLILGLSSSTPCIPTNPKTVENMIVI